MSPESTGPTLPDWSEKHRRLKGKMGVIFYTTLTKKKEEDGLALGSTLERSRIKRGGKCAFPDTLTAFYLEIEQPYANAFPCLALKLWNAHRWKEEKRNMTCNFFFLKKKQKPKACIDSKLSHPRQDVVSDRPVHTSWALFVPGMWSPSNQSQQLSQCNGEEEDRRESGRGGPCINIASSISPTPPSSCSVHLHTKGATMACAPRFWSASITD